MKSSYNFIFLLLLFLSACTDSSKIISKPKPKVQVASVVVKDIPIYVDTFGTLSESQNVNIKPKVSGEIKHIYFEKAAFVKAGDLLLTLDTAIYEANALNDEAAIKQDIADAKLKEYLVSKNAPLVQKGALPKQDYERMKTDLEGSLAKIETDRAKLLLDKINIEYCSISSPIDGVVGINNTDVGNYVTPSEILLNIKDTTKLYVDFTLPEKNIARLKKALANGDLKILIYVKKLNNNNETKNKEYEGVLSFLNNTSDPATGTISLRAEINNKKNQLLPGEYADIKLLLGTRKDAILVPKSAVQLGPEGQYLYKLKDNSIVEMVSVHTIGADDKNFILDPKSGISRIDKIVTVGLQNLSTGVKVEIVNAKTQSDSPKL